MKSKPQKKKDELRPLKPKNSATKGAPDHNDPQVPYENKDES